MTKLLLLKELKKNLFNPPIHKTLNVVYEKCDNFLSYSHNGDYIANKDRVWDVCWEMGNKVADLPMFSTSPIIPIHHHPLTFIDLLLLVQIQNIVVLIKNISL